MALLTLNYCAIYFDLFRVCFYNFLTVSTLYQFNQPKYTQDYIVVLGSGLINGEIVPPLLQARINKAIQFYKAQNRATLNPPKSSCLVVKAPMNYFLKVSR